MGNLKEMDKLLKQEEIENFNRPITSKEIELVIKKISQETRVQGQMAFRGNSTKHLRKS